MALNYRMSALIAVVAAAVALAGPAVFDPTVFGFLSGRVTPAAQPDLLVAPAPTAAAAAAASLQQARVSADAQPLSLAAATVSGNLTVNALPWNLFDFATNRFLGDLNARFSNAAPNTPTNLRVVDGKVEFGYMSSNEINVDVETSGRVTLSVRSALGWGNLRIALTSSAFSAASGFTVVKDTTKGVANVTAALAGDTLAFSFPENPTHTKDVFVYTVQLVSEHQK